MQEGGKQERTGSSYYINLLLTTKGKECDRRDCLLQYQPRPGVSSGYSLHDNKRLKAGGARYQ